MESVHPHDDYDMSAFFLFLYLAKICLAFLTPFPLFIQLLCEQKISLLFYCSKMSITQTFPSSPPPFATTTTTTPIELLPSFLFAFLPSSYFSLWASFFLSSLTFSYQCYLVNKEANNPLPRSLLFMSWWKKRPRLFCFVVPVPAKSIILMAAWRLLAPETYQIAEISTSSNSSKAVILSVFFNPI